MNKITPIVYFYSLVAFLVGLTIFVLFKIIKTRWTENRFSKLK